MTKEILKRTIKALSLGKIEEGSIGFITTDENDVHPNTGKPKWFNVLGETEQLKELIKNVVAKGNIIEFEYNNGVVGSLKLIEKAKEEKNWHDDMTNYEDLLSAAHKKAKEEKVYLNIESKPQKDATGNPLVDFEKKTALYEATLTLTDKEGKILQKIVDTGDAEGITTDTIKPHFNRMASTRAMARCYRIYTNNAKVAKEEIEQ